MMLSERKGLELSRHLYETKGADLLNRLGLQDCCAVCCVGGTSQNAGLDDLLSRDHMWGPYITFVLQDTQCHEHTTRLESALAEMTDEVDGTSWVGYDGPFPRKTAVWKAVAFLRTLTGLRKPPGTEEEWLAVINRQGFLGRRWTEQLFDARCGVVFHGQWFENLWTQWTRFPPASVQMALVARSAFRTWNSGPEYNLRRIVERHDTASFRLCAARFVEEVIELLFTCAGEFTPAYKWRMAHLRQLNALPPLLLQTIEAMAVDLMPERCIVLADEIVTQVKMKLLAQYSLEIDLKTPLSLYAQTIRKMIANEAVRDATLLDWWVDLA